MPLYRVTVKQMKVCNGLRIEKGMVADVVTNSGQAVNDEFIGL